MTYESKRHGARHGIRRVEQYQPGGARAPWLIRGSGILRGPQWCVKVSKYKTECGALMIRCEDLRQPQNAMDDR